MGCCLFCYAPGCRSDAEVVNELVVQLLSFLEEIRLLEGFLASLDGFLVKLLINGLNQSPSFRSVVYIKLHLCNLGSSGTNSI